MKEQYFLALSELFLPKKGGHIIWFYEICKRIGNVRLITQRLSNLPERENVEGIDVFRLAMPRLGWLKPEELLVYLKMLWGGLRSPKNKYNAVLSARVLPEGLVGNLIAKFLGVPSVVIAHGEEINRVVNDSREGVVARFKRKMKKGVLLNTFSSSDLVIANSSFTRKLLVDQGIDSSKVQVVHPGVDPQTFFPGEKDPYLLEKYELFDKSVLLTIGRLTPRKGHDMVIKALPDLIREVPNIRYIIAGGGTNEHHLKKLVFEAGLSNYVIFLGEVDDSLIYKLYNLSDVFIMANRKSSKTNDVEGFGIVFLEANSCGKPVIGGRSGGVVDSIVDGHTGILVDGEDLEDISSSIISLFNDKTLAESMGKFGRNRVLNELTWEHSASTIKNLILEIR